MTYKVGPKGQVVVPKRIRERLGIEPGDEVLVEEDEGEVRIRRAGSPTRLRGLLHERADRLTAAVEVDHRWEMAHDDMREAEWALVDHRP